MSTPFDFRGLHCSPAGADPMAWHYLPLRPDVQRGPDGAPMLSLVDMGSSGYLMFSAEWAAPDADLAALREAIARRSGVAAAQLRLAFAPLAEPHCNALIGDGSGAFQTLGSSTTSGLPPYSAVFNLLLQEWRLAQAKAALRGEAGFLAIEYLAGRPAPLHARASFDARASDLLPWIRARSAAAGLRALLDEAVQRGLATVRLDAPAEQLGQLAVDLYERVLDQAAGALPHWLEAVTDGELHAAVTLDQHVNQPIRAFADIGAIVAPGSARAPSGAHDAADRQGI